MVVLWDCHCISFKHIHSTLKVYISFLTSYRKYSLKYHPEKNRSPGSSQKFDELAEAYDVLSNRK